MCTLNFEFQRSCCKRSIAVDYSLDEIEHGGNIMGLAMLRFPTLVKEAPKDRVQE